eukprot:g2786.t1
MYEQALLYERDRMFIRLCAPGKRAVTPLQRRRSSAQLRSKRRSSDEESFRHAFALRALFDYYCKLPKASADMGTMKFSKFCKGCHHLVKDNVQEGKKLVAVGHVDSVTIDLCYSKAKGERSEDARKGLLTSDAASTQRPVSRDKNSSGMDFATFARALFLLAESRYAPNEYTSPKKRRRKKKKTNSDSNMNSNKAAAAATITDMGTAKEQADEGNVGKERMNDGSGEAKMTSYRGHFGGVSYFLQLMDEHVFWNTGARERRRARKGKRDKEGKSIIPKFRKMLQADLDGRAEWAANVLQRNVRGLLGKTMFGLARKAARRAKRMKELTHSAIACQTRIRRNLARKHVVDEYRRVCIKYIDALSGEPYWFNPKSGVTTWTKPMLLGDLDVRSIVELPDPDREYSMVCSNCNDMTVRWLCYDCEENYCQECSETLHAKGKKSKHEQIKIDVCVECEFQIASRKCNECEDEYCDTCYWKMHQRGNLAGHTWTALVDLCEVCDPKDKAVAARVYCDGKKMCMICYNSWYYTQGYVAEELEFSTIRLKQQREKVRLERQAVADAAAKVRREEADKRMRVIALVTRLQNRWRMRKVREEYAPLLESVHVERLAKEKREREAAKIKSTRLYKLQSLLEMAPPLETDSHEVRVEKLLPAELTREQLLRRYPWLTEEEVKKCAYVGPRKTGIARTTSTISKALSKDGRKKLLRVSGNIAGAGMEAIVGDRLNEENRKVLAQKARSGASSAAKAAKAGATKRTGMAGAKMLGGIANSLERRAGKNALTKALKRGAKRSKRFAKREERKKKIEELRAQARAEREQWRQEELAKWSKYQDEQTGSDRWYNEETGEIREVDPAEDFAEEEEDGDADGDAEYLLEESDDDSEASSSSSSSNSSSSSGSEGGDGDADHSDSEHDEDYAYEEAFSAAGDDYGQSEFETYYDENGQPYYFDAASNSTSYDGVTWTQF